MDRVTIRRSSQAAASIALAVGVLLLAAGLGKVGGQALFAAWEPGAFARFGAFVALAIVLFAALQWLWAVAWWPATGVVVAGGMLLAFGPAAVTATALLLAGAWALGSWLVPRENGGEADDRVTVSVLTTGVGLALFSCVGHSLSHLPVNKPGMYIALLTLPLAMRLRHSFAGGIAVPGATPRGARTLFDRFGQLLLGLVVLVQFAHAALPELYWDALAMHLYVPAHLAMFGEWSYDPAKYTWALFPMGADWLFTYAFVLGGEMAAKLLNFAFGAATTLLVYRESKRFLSAGWAGLLAAASMSAPILLLQSTSLLVENGLMFFMFVGYLLVERLSKTWRGWASLWVVVAALCGIKLQGAVYATGLTLVALVRAAHKADLRPPAAAWASAVPTLLLALQPYLTAYWISGNPLFPFFNAIFKSPLFPSDQNFVDLRWARGWSLDSVWGMTFESPNYLETGSPGTLGFFVLTLGLVTVVSVLTRRSPAAVRACVLALFYLGVVGSSVQYIRYFSPVLPLLAVASIPMVHIAGRFVDRALQLTLVAVIALNLIAIPSGGWLLKGFHPSRLTALDGREQIERDLVPQRKLTELVGQRERRPVKVAYFGVPAGAGLRGDAIYFTWYNTAFSAAMNAATTELEVARAIGEVGGKYVIANLAEQFPNYQLVGRALKAHATLVERVGWAQLFLLDDQFWLTPELLRNSSLELDNSGWDVSSTLANVGGAAILQVGNGLAQTVPIPPSQRRLEGHVTLKCMSDETLVWVRVEWTGASLAAEQGVSERVMCGGLSSQVVPFSLEPSPSAERLTVMVNSLRGGAVGVDEVSVRSVK